MDKLKDNSANYLGSSKVGIVVQARMGSTRLPGKVLKDLHGRPMLAWSVERLKKVMSADLLIVATTTETGDDILAEWLETQSILYFRGSDTDVLDRYYQCAKKFNLAHILRATGDNPLVDPVTAEDVVSAHLLNRNDYTAALPEFGGNLPIGLGTEIFSMPALTRSWELGKSLNHREHANEYIHENLTEFKTQFLKSKQDWGKWPDSLTVDTMKDFKAVELFIETALK